MDNTEYENDETGTEESPEAPSQEQQEDFINPQTDNREFVSVEDNMSGFKIALASNKFNVSELGGLALDIREKWFASNGKKREPSYTK